ncbi:putative ABC transport system transmembrane protein [[Actinomadura] parvosata subsp. kistnae]|nr:putative ABC transport system transmembrane protein [Actinomadura parvosata subsp. kistnae]
MRSNGELFLAGQISGLKYGAAEVGYARRLLERPDSVDRVRAHWDRLTASNTTIDQALPLLGLNSEFPATKLEGCR